MSGRLQDRKALNGARQALLGLEEYANSSGIERNLLDLLRLRVSQINGCAFCLAMHAKDLLDEGERADRIYVLDAWRETDWFTDRERAALAWAEAVTSLPNREVPDDVYEQARTQFSEKELADLTLAVIAINGWNRINISFKNPPKHFDRAPELATAGAAR